MTLYFLRLWLKAGCLRPMLVAAVCLALSACKPAPSAPQGIVADGAPDMQRAIHHPLHFAPAALDAKDEECLACHKEIGNDTPRKNSPAGLSTADARAWYQRLDTYRGEQAGFHFRHLGSPHAREVMNLRCNFCHTGLDPREMTPGSAKDGFALRKKTDPETTCLKCHGQFNFEAMNLPGPWAHSGPMAGGNCLACHATIRTERHKVSYLNAAAIEEAGAKSSDACYGCHGGRAWYRSHYPYPRHAWPGMPDETPAWAKDRLVHSEARFVKSPR